MIRKGASQVAWVVKNKNHLPVQETWEMWFPSLGWEDPLEEGMATHSNILALRIPWTEKPGGLQATGSQSLTRLKWLSTRVHMLRKTAISYSCREGSGTPLQCSCLENPMDGGAWWAAVHGVAKSWAWLSDFTFTFHFHALEKEMATHSSVLAWRIPGTAEPGRPLSMGLHRVGHDWSDLAATAAVWTS